MTRYRKLEAFIDRLETDGVLSADVARRLGVLASDCDYQEREILATSEWISNSLTSFVKQVTRFGALHNSPSGYSKWSRFEADVRILEVNVKSLVSMLRLVVPGQALVTSLEILDVDNGE